MGKAAFSGDLPGFLQGLTDGSRGAAENTKEDDLGIVFSKGEPEVVDPTGTVSKRRYNPLHMVTRRLRVAWSNRKEVLR